MGVVGGRQLPPPYCLRSVSCPSPLASCISLLRLQFILVLHSLEHNILHDFRPSIVSYVGGQLPPTCSWSDCVENQGCTLDTRFCSCKLRRLRPCQLPRSPKYRCHLWLCRLPCCQRSRPQGSSKSRSTTMSRRDVVLGLIDGRYEHSFALEPCAIALSSPFIAPSLDVHLASSPKNHHGSHCQYLQLLNYSNCIWHLVPRWNFQVKLQFAKHRHGVSLNVACSLDDFPQPMGAKMVILFWSLLTCALIPFVAWRFPGTKHILVCRRIASRRYSWPRNRPREVAFLVPQVLRTSGDSSLASSWKAVVGSCRRRRPCMLASQSIAMLLICSLLCSCRLAFIHDMFCQEHDIAGAFGCNLETMVGSCRHGLFL